MALIKYDPKWNRFAEIMPDNKRLTLHKVESSIYNYDRELFLYKLLNSTDEPLKGNKDFEEGRYGLRTRILELFNSKNEIVATTVVYTLRTFDEAGYSKDFPTNTQTVEDFYFILGCPLAAVLPGDPGRTRPRYNERTEGTRIPVINSLQEFINMNYPD